MKTPYKTKLILSILACCSVQSAVYASGAESIMYQYDGEANMARLRSLPQPGGRVVMSADGPLEGHGAHKSVYVDLFDLGHGLPTDKTGRYVFSGHMPAGEHHRYQHNRTWTKLVFVDEDGGMFSTVSTHNKLEREGALYGGFVVSYNPAHKLRMLHGAHIQNHNEVLPRGLYDIQPTSHKNKARHEQWANLNTGHSYTVLLPDHAGSIPGMFGVHPIDVGPLSAAVSSLQEGIRQEKNRLDLAIPAGYSGHFISPYGPMGSGKTTILQAKLGGVLKADVDLRLDGSPTIEGLRISDSSAAAGTTRHTIKIGPDGQAYVDLCGIRDLAGGPTEIQNAATMAYLLGDKARKSKILLTFIEGQLRNGRGYMLETLNQLVDMVPDSNLLHNSVSMVMTDQMRSSPLREIKKHLRNFRAAGNVNPRVIALLEFLQQRPERLFVMPAPEDEGLYETADFNAEFDTVLNSYEPVTFSPETIRTSVSPDATVFALIAGMELHAYISHLLSVEGPRLARKMAAQTVLDSHAAAAGLREQVNGHRTHLINLKKHNFAQLNTFRTSWEVFFEPTAVNEPLFEALNNLRFLCGLSDELATKTTAIPGLPTAFDGVIAHLAHLARPPAFDDAEAGVLKVTGAIIGLSELAGQVGAGLRPHLSRVDVFASNKLVLDSHIVRNASVSLISPVWDVITPSHLKLDGAVGAAGAHGMQSTAGIAGGDATPGLPGNNGGHFYGKGYQFFGMNNLAISSNGGTGGAGGNGGQGSAAGKGALGGNGGLAGSCELVGAPFAFAAINGVNGSNGDPGMTLPYGITVPTEGSYRFQVNSRDCPEYNREFYLWEAALWHVGRDWVRVLNHENTIKAKPENMKRYIEERQGIARESITQISGHNPGNPHAHKVHHGGNREWFANDYIINYTYKRPDTVTPAAPTALAALAPVALPPTLRDGIESAERVNSYWLFFQQDASTGAIVPAFPGL